MKYSKVGIVRLWNNQAYCHWLANMLLLAFSTLIRALCLLVLLNQHDVYTMISPFIWALTIMFLPLSQVKQVLMWVACLSCGLCCLFTKLDWYRHRNPTTVFGKLCIAFFDRILWSIFVAWVTFACCAGRGGEKLEIFASSASLCISCSRRCQYTWRKGVTWKWFNADNICSHILWFFLRSGRNKWGRSETRLTAHNKFFKCLTKRPIAS